ncbi:hypothetical protein FFWV33_01030 [Flavobacterium faecale]|uniref:Uncharacterized protein n=1 Tax=Flavobacterium faecale TaxID=1355330 RepID=A0A2S1L8Z6_9FLAO|nr:hypothetical protein FFWV33_01030 [Flavobacterium faecale]
MGIFDTFISVVVFALVAKLVWDKFQSHPSDKYHNDSWKEARKNIKKKYICINETLRILSVYRNSTIRYRLEY